MATKRWLGQAAATFDIWTISLSGTVTSQTYSANINGKSITFTAGGADTVATVIAGLVAVWTSVTSPPPPEFSELTPVVSGTTLVATGTVAGRPSTVTVSTSGGATYSITHTATATGPNDFTNAQNWSTGSAPANSDVLVFDNGSTDCKYNLTSSLTGVTVLVQGGFSGDIGLPFINSDNSQMYAEYRTTSLTLAGGTLTINCPTIARGNFAFGANTTTIRILNTSSQRQDAYTPIILVTGGNSSSEIDISKGDVGVAFYQGTTATFPIINTGFAGNASSDVKLVCGAGSTLTTVSQNGGKVILQANVTTANVGINGGMLTMQDNAATTINARGGTVVINSTGTMATINLYGAATLDFSQDTRAKTVTNAIAVGDTTVTVIDPQKTVNSGVLTLATANLPSVNVNHGANTQIVYT